MKPLKIMSEVFRLPNSDRRWCRLSQVVILVDEIGHTTDKRIDIRPDRLISMYGHLSPTVRRIAEIPDSDVRVFHYYYTEEQCVVAKRAGTTLPIDHHELLQTFVDADWVEALVQHLLGK